MQAEGTLLLRRIDVEELLSLGDCLDGVEEVFRLQGQGKIPPSEILAVRARDGGLHVKAGFLPGGKSYIVAKLNSNFPGNRAQFQLPTIQGVIVVCDAENGSPLAILDSIDITVKRTAAASAVAAKYLARKDSSVVTICGCGQQGRAQLRGIQAVLPLKKVYAFDVDPGAARQLAIDLSRKLEIDIEPARDLASAIRKSDVCVTCTPAKEFFIHKEHVAWGMFIAAVGADDKHKQEIDPALMASAKVVTDSLEQCCSIGDTHHAIAKGLMREEDIYAELSEIAAGRKAGRVSADEIIVFDSTGLAIEDAVAAVAVYEKARTFTVGSQFSFGG